MLFKEDLARLIAEDLKHETRRPQKAGDSLTEIDGLKTLMQKNRIKYQVGRDYAVQYAYGKPCRYWHEQEGLMPFDFYQRYTAEHGENFHEICGLMGWKPLRIKILDIYSEDVRYIKPANAKLEGFSCPDEFLCTWTEFYDKKIYAGWLPEESVATWFDSELSPYASDVVNFDVWLIENRPAHLYQAWAFRFEIAK